MLIRSQGKTVLIDTNVIYVENQTNIKAIYNSNGDVFKIGSYKDEKRCIEVLDLIQQVFGNSGEYTQIYQMPNE